MVARETPPHSLLDQTLDVVRDSALALFRGWRRLLGSLALAVSRIQEHASALGRAWLAQWRPIGAYYRHPTEAWTAKQGHAASVSAAFGVRVFAFALLAGAALAVGTGTSWRSAAVTAVVELLWAGARYAVVMALVPPTLLDRHKTSAAYFAGLAAFGVGLTAALRLIVLVPSGIITLAGLRGAGLDRRDAIVAVTWAFGGQLGVVALGWLLRGGLALVFAL